MHLWYSCMPCSIIWYDSIPSTLSLTHDIHTVHSGNVTNMISDVHISISQHACNTIPSMYYHYDPAHTIIVVHVWDTMVILVQHISVLTLVCLLSMSINSIASSSSVWIQGMFMFHSPIISDVSFSFIHVQDSRTNLTVYLIIS